MTWLRWGKWLVLPRREAAIHFLFSIPLLLCPIIIVNIIVNIMTIIIIVPGRKAAIHFLFLILLLLLCHHRITHRRPLPKYFSTQSIFLDYMYATAQKYFSTHEAPPQVLFPPRPFTCHHHFMFCKEKKLNPSCRIFDPQGFELPFTKHGGRYPLGMGY